MTEKEIIEILEELKDDIAMAKELSEDPLFQDKTDKEIQAIEAGAKAIRRLRRLKDYMEMLEQQ